MTDNDARYAEIMRRLQQRKQQKAVQSARLTLASVLDALNAAGALADIPRRHYGPARQTGRANGHPCLASVIWWPGAGFYGYKLLTVLGVWAVPVPGEHAPEIHIGSKRLPYTAATYNPEAYHRLLRKGYRAYHADDGAPPPRPLRAFTYQPDERLGQRDMLREAVLALVEAVG